MAVLALEADNSAEKIFQEYFDVLERSQQN
jgi:hypothetical protein